MPNSRPEEDARSTSHVDAFPDDQVREGIVTILDIVVELHMVRVCVCNGGREEKRGDGVEGECVWRFEDALLRFSHTQELIRVDFLN
jgi:hypothetical protein